MLNAIQPGSGCLFALIALEWQIIFAQVAKVDNSSRTTIVRARLKTNASLPCLAFEADKPVASAEFWHFGSERRKIGGLDTDGNVKLVWDRDGAYEIRRRSNDTPILLIKGVRRELVDKYECVVLYADGRTLSSFVYFRLDFSFWYDQRWNSLFYGSLLASLIFCAASFILNVIWIGCRKAVLWWINRTERMSRVRSMVEAMEKYRQRQIENLHDTYHRRMTAIRENYHQQVEQLRVSYGTQVGRFRGYRQAQMENVTQHLDNICDNYNQQLSRVREYGARRTERLWENYERQLNRMRMFTLEQRLKLMRQYKVKQRYINKLLETLADSTNPDEIQKRESEIRAALNLPIDPSAFPHTTISRASSYYSLPEFVIEDDYALPPHNAADVPSTSRVAHNVVPSATHASSHSRSSNLAFVHATQEPDGVEPMSSGVAQRRASRSLYGATSGSGRQRGDSESNTCKLKRVDVDIELAPSLLDEGDHTSPTSMCRWPTGRRHSSVASHHEMNPITHENADSDHEERVTEQGRLLSLKPSK